jgi:hypothetical protein
MAFIEDKTIDLDAIKITPLQWWLVPEQRRRYPRLHRMAIKIIAGEPPKVRVHGQLVCAEAHLFGGAASDDCRSCGDG